MKWSEELCKRDGPGNEAWRKQQGGWFQVEPGQKKPGWRWGLRLEITWSGQRRVSHCRWECSTKHIKGWTFCLVHKLNGPVSALFHPQTALHRKCFHPNWKLVLRCQSCPRYLAGQEQSRTWDFMFSVCIWTLRWRDLNCQNKPCPSLAIRYFWSKRVSMTLLERNISLDRIRASLGLSEA